MASRKALSVEDREILTYSLLFGFETKSWGISIQVQTYYPRSMQYERGEVCLSYLAPLPIGRSNNGNLHIICVGGDTRFVIHRFPATHNIIVIYFSKRRGKMNWKEMEGAMLCGTHRASKRKVFSSFFVIYVSSKDHFVHLFDF